MKNDSVEAIRDAFVRRRVGDADFEDEQLRQQVNQLHSIGN